MSKLSTCSDRTKGLHGSKSPIQLHTHTYFFLLRCPPINKVTIRKKMKFSASIIAMAIAAPLSASGKFNVDGCRDGGRILKMYCNYKMLVIPCHVLVDIVVYKLLDLSAIAIVVSIKEYDFRKILTLLMFMCIILTKH